MELQDVCERQGGSSKQYLLVRKNDETHARLLTVRETAQLMGVPDSFSLPGSYSERYNTNLNLKTLILNGPSKR